MKKSPGLEALLGLNVLSFDAGRRWVRYRNLFAVLAVPVKLP